MAESEERAAAMLTVERFSVHLLAFVVLMAGLAALTNVWHRVDYAVYHRFYLPKEVPFSPAVVLVDMPRFRTPADHSDPTDWRLRLADLLNHIAAGRLHPDVVALDVVFGNDPRGLPELSAAVDALRRSEVSVYAVVDPMEPNGGGTLLPWDKIWEDQAASLYQDHLTGYGHTQINAPFMGVLSYDPTMDLKLPDGSSMQLMALQVKVIADRNATPPPSARSIVFPVASPAAVAAQTYQFQHMPGLTSRGYFMQGADTTSPDLANTIVLVGSLGDDQPGQVSVAGPVLVASALSAELLGGVALQPIDRPGLLIVEILVFAALTVALFALLFQYVKRLQTMPVLTATLAGMMAVAALAGVAAAGRALGFATPVGLALVAIVLAGIVTWHFALKFLVTGVADGSGQYDIFISYSRQQGDWVVANLLTPLKALRKPDGSPLSIYFDRESISIGEAFTTKYMWAIVDSKFFLPVFSPEYYAKNHCRNEIDLGYKRYVDKRIKLIPVALSLAAVPDIYTPLNIVLVDQDPAFFETIKKRLLQGEPSPPA